MAAAVAKLAHFGYVTALAEQPRLIGQRPPSQPRKQPIATSVEFKRAMSRLQNDFDSLGKLESDIVREVNQRQPGAPRPCPLEWVNGEAALSLDASQLRLPPSLTSAVTRCAAAVEQYRAEQESAR